MIFLNPAVLFGLLAASIPVLIHLLNLRKLKKIEFSSIRFLQELQRSKIRKVKFKQWILLLLRVLIILMLVAAFARPTIETVSIEGTGSATKTTAVFVIDDSYSMSVIGNEGSYFNQSKTMVSGLAGEFQEGDLLNIIFTSEPNEIIQLAGVQDIEKTLQVKQISFAKGNLSLALSNALDLLSNSENYNKELYFLSDLQKSNFKEEEIKEISNSENIKLYIAEVGNDFSNNIGITSFEIKDQLFSPDKPILLEASVKNYSQNEKSTVMSVFVNGERVAQKQIDFSPNSNETINFEISYSGKGLLNILAEIEDDEILMDNKRYTAVLLPEKINLLFVSEKREDGIFAEAALTSSGEEYFNFDFVQTGQMLTKNLSEYNLILLNGINSNLSLDKIQEYVLDGGNLFVFSSAIPDLRSMNKLFIDLGLPGVKSLKQLEPNQLITFGDVDYQHPLFENIFESNEKKEFDSPQIKKYLDLASNSNSSSIIKLADGTPFLLSSGIERGKVLFFNSTLDLTFNNFPLKSIFAPLLFKSVYYLSGSEKPEQSVFVGEPIIFSVNKKNVEEISIIKPDNSSYNVVQDSLSNNKLRYNNTTLPGVYRLMEEEKINEIGIVNTETGESEKEKISSEELEQILITKEFKGVSFVFNFGDNIKDVIYQSRFGSELWKMFLIIALILAIVEMWIAKSSRKDIAEISG